jgi:predicted site-specific integrase-resolvase
MLIVVVLGENEMKLSEYAKKLGLNYKTVWRYWQQGLIPNAYQLPTGTVIVNEEVQHTSSKSVTATIYARVSSSENKKNLESQADRLKSFCMAKGYQISKVVMEVGSGVNDNRRQLNQLLKDKNVKLIVIEHKDRLTRFGFNYLQTLLEIQGRRIEVVNLSLDDKQDLMQDFVSIITSFCSRIYGQRRNKRQTEKLIEALSQ